MCITFKLLDMIGLPKYIVTLESSHRVQQWNTFLLHRPTGGQSLQPGWFPDGRDVTVEPTRGFEATVTPAYTSAD